MTAMIDTGTQPASISTATQRAPGSTYRLKGEFRESMPVGAFVDGIRFLSRCTATVVSDKPERVRNQDGRMSMDVNGFVMAPDESPMPLSAVMAAPGFDFPDFDYRLTGSAYIRSNEPQYAHLDGSVVSIEGWVNFESGELEVEARSL